MTIETDGASSSEENLCRLLSGIPHLPIDATSNQTCTNLSQIAAVNELQLTVPQRASQNLHPCLGASDGVFGDTFALPGYYIEAVEQFQDKRHVRCKSKRDGMNR